MVNASWINFNNFWWILYKKKKDMEINNDNRNKIMAWVVGR